MIYTYEITSPGPHLGTTLEIEHPISQSPLAETTLESGEIVKVKRLISGSTNFILKGDCWARTNYSRGAQDKVTAEDRSKFGKKP